MRRRARTNFRKRGLGCRELYLRVRDISEDLLLGPRKEGVPRTPARKVLSPTWLVRTFAVVERALCGTFFALPVERGDRETLQSTPSDALPR